MNSCNALPRKKEFESEIDISYSSFNIVDEKYNCCTMLGTQINSKHIVYLFARNFNNLQLVRKFRDQNGKLF